MRRMMIIAVLTGALLLPILFGASCPQPTAPFFTQIGAGTGRTATQIPSCSPGFVCISIVNTTCVNVEVSLYVHDGFDLSLELCEFERGIVIGGTQLRPSEECPGFNLGEYQIARPQLFEPPGDLPSNLFPIQGRDTRLLRPRETVQVRVQEGDIKTFGIDVGLEGSLPGDPALREAPFYRCTQVNLGTTRVPRAREHIPSGDTFQFVVFDEVNCALPGTAQLAVRTASSATGGCPPVQ